MPLPYPQLPDVLASLRQDTRSGLVPVFVLLPLDEPNLAQENRERRLRQITSDDPRIRYVRGPLTAEALTQEVGQPGATPEAPIPEAERKAMALRAIENLRLRTGFDMSDCAGLILSSSSLVPMDRPPGTPPPAMKIVIAPGL